jgi:hypothetical protein
MQGIETPKQLRARPARDALARDGVLERANNAHVTVPEQDRLVGRRQDRRGTHF